MKKQLIINEQKLKFYSTNQLRYSDRMRSNFREEISDKDTLVNYILEQLKCNKVDEVSWSCFLQELMGCVEIEQVPETFEELIKLCKTLNTDRIRTTKQVIYIKPTSCWLGEIRVNCMGAIMNSDFQDIAYHRSMSQLWAFIKSLIGEE